jgi:hypothetical protein
MIGYVDALEEAGLLQEFIGVLDYVDSTLAVAERYRPHQSSLGRSSMMASGCSTILLGSIADTLGR